MEKYSITIIYSEEDEGFVATIPEFPGLSAYGETPEEAIEEAQIVLKGFIEVFKEDCCRIPAPHTFESYSGQTRLRLPKNLHAKLSKQAEREGVSLNTYMVQLLSENHIKHQIEKKLNRIEQLICVSTVFQNGKQLKHNKSKNYMVRTTDWDQEKTSNFFMH